MCGCCGKRCGTTNGIEEPLTGSFEAARLKIFGAPSSEISRNVASICGDLEQLWEFQIILRVFWQKAQQECGKLKFWRPRARRDSRERIIYCFNQKKSLTMSRLGFWRINKASLMELTGRPWTYGSLLASFCAGNDLSKLLFSLSAPCFISFKIHTQPGACLMLQKLFFTLDKPNIAQQLWLWRLRWCINDVLADDLCGKSSNKFVTGEGNHSRKRQRERMNYLLRGVTRYFL